MNPKAVILAIVFVTSGVITVMTWTDTRPAESRASHPAPAA